MWRHVLLGSTKAFHCLLLQVFHQSWSSRRIDICGKSGSVGSWWSWFSLGTIAIINWILFLYTCSYAFRSSFHTVWGVASKHTNYKADSNNWDMRWRIIVMPCMFLGSLQCLKARGFWIHHSVSCVSAECRCFHGEIGSIGTSMTRISNDWTLGSMWRCYHNPIDSCHIQTKHPLMSMFLWNRNYI